MIDRSNVSTVSAMKSVAVTLLASTCLTMALPAGAQDVVPPDVYTLTPTGVSMSDGAYVSSDTDLKIGSLSLERFATWGPIHDDVTMSFGNHTGNNFDVYFKQRTLHGPKDNPYQYFRGIVHMGNSASSSYDLNYTVTPTFISPNSDDATSGILEKSGSAIVYTDQTGTVYTFDGSSNTFQNVANIVYANGRRLTFTTNGANNTRLITSSDGFAIVLQYTGSVITAACGFNMSRTYVSSATTCTGAALLATYTYSSGTLASATNVLGTTTYTYGASGQCITPPGYTTCKVRNEYTGNGTGSGDQVVLRQTLADGSVWNFVGGGTNTRSADYDPNVNEDSSLSVTNPKGETFGMTFTKSSPYTFTDGNGKKTQYRFFGGRPNDSVEPSNPPIWRGKNLMQAILPEGNEYDATYDVGTFDLPVTRTWKAKPGSGLADRTQTFSYPSCAAPNTRQNCVHAIAITDPKGNQTSFVYTSYGSIQSEMQPAPMAGAARPLKLYTYVQKYAYIKNSGGSLVTAATPIWMPASETLCPTVAGASNNVPTCDATAPRTQTTYEYGADGVADNLLVRGTVVTDLATGISRRTCATYDDRARKLSETKPRANLAVCP